MRRAAIGLGGLGAIMATVALGTGPATGGLFAPAAYSANRAAPPPAARPRWTPEQVRALIAEVRGARDEGLDPSDYGADALGSELGQAIDVYGANGSRQLDALADASALALAHDYAQGRVLDARQFEKGATARPTPLRPGLEAALRAGRVRPWLRSLLPGDPRYTALKEAYRKARPGDEPRRSRLRANLERLRWQPRGGREILIAAQVQPDGQIGFRADAARQDAAIVAALDGFNQSAGAPRRSVERKRWNLLRRLRQR